jgi:hypothetical protein
MNRDHSQADVRPRAFWGTRYSVGLVVLGAIPLYFLLTEHQAHFIYALPFLLLLACPFMHIFTHHGQGGHGNGHGDEQGRPLDGPRADKTPPAVKKPGSVS